MIDSAAISRDAGLAIDRVFKDEKKTRTAMMRALGVAIAMSNDVTTKMNTVAATGARHLPVCKEGCAYCCHQAIFITVPEAILVSEHMRSFGDTDAVHAKVAETKPKILSLAMQKRQALRIPCPALDTIAGSCTVHQVRPVMCRGLNSCDVGQCIKAFDAKSLVSKVSQNPFQAPVHHAVWMGMMAAFYAHGLDGDVYDLVLALEIALGTHDAPERWLAGEKLFASARTPASRAATASYASDVSPIVKRLKAARSEAR